MSKSLEFKPAALSYATLKVKQLAGTPSDLHEEDKEYTLVADFNAIAKAQEHLGRDFTDISNWQGMTGVDVVTLAWCTLDRFHPDVTLEQVRGMLPPQQTARVWELLVEMCFPGILERAAAITNGNQEKPGPRAEVEIPLFQTP